jgi:microcompartment protein CcmK/EutM
MYLARVIGTVVATTKTPGLDGIRLLVVQPVDEDGRERQKPLVAADVTQAGPGDLVHVTTSREAALAMPEPFVPVDAAIVAIVDQVHVEHRVARPDEVKSGKAKKAAKS